MIKVDIPSLFFVKVGEGERRVRETGKERRVRETGKERREREGEGGGERETEGKKSGKERDEKDERGKDSGTVWGVV